MGSLPYHVAASRADSAMERVTVTVKCPDCDQPVRCVVDGTEVDVPDCADPADTCYGATRVERITEDARERAQGKRDDYARHLREYDER